MSEKEIVHDILSKALDADESGDKESAFNYYTKAVELILHIKDATVKEQLNKYAVQALERAEELRGVTSSKPKNATNSVNAQEQHQSYHRSLCKLNGIF